MDTYYTLLGDEPIFTHHVEHNDGRPHIHISRIVSETLLYNNQ